MKTPTLIHRYKPKWAQNFEDLKHVINECLIGLDCKIEHVGSTSVPGLASKPIIDIDIIFENPSDFEKIKSGLTNMGYYHNGDQGIAEREVFKRNGERLDRILDTIQHHLYVCPEHSAALERHILLRNHLRKNKTARLQYEALKYELAEKATQNKKVYAELKELNINGFIDKIIEKEKLN